MEKRDLSYDEFLCLALLYAAHVSDGLADDEKAAIIGHVGNETFDKVYDIYNDMSDFEALETIIAHRGIHYPTATQRDEVLARIKAIFKADDDFDVVEKEIYHFLKNLL